MKCEKVQRKQNQQKLKTKDFQSSQIFLGFFGFEETNGAMQILHKNYDVTIGGDFYV